MMFGEKLKEERKKRGLTQQMLADIVGVSLRTIAGYESENRYPRTRELYHKLAEAVAVDVNYLLTENEEFTVSAGERYGVRGVQQAQALVDRIGGMYAGGELSEDDMDAVMKAMQKLYWDAKEENKKYASKKLGSDE